MAEMLLVNPRRKKRKHRKMSALQRRYFGPRRNPSRRRRRIGVRRNPSTNVVPFYGAAPKRRRRRAVHRRSSLRRRHARTFRGFAPRSFINDTLMPAGVGAIGALGVDMALSYASPFLPAMLSSGIGLAAARIGGAVAVGYAASMAMGRRFGEQVTAGAITVTLYDLIKAQVRTMGLPGISGLGWVSPSMQVGTYVGDGMSSYDGSYQGSLSGLGMTGAYPTERDSDYVQQTY